MSVKDGLLALLHAGDAHGYQLKTEFEAATGDAWPLNIGQVYTSLHRLERDGLVEVAAEDGERKTYRLTAAGRESLGEWLSAPVERSIEARDEVAMKILLAVRTPDHDPVRVIATQRSSTMATLQRLTRQKAAAGVPELERLIHLDRLILRCRAELDWLDLTEERLVAGGNGSPSRARASGGTVT